VRRRDHRRHEDDYDRRREHILADEAVPETISGDDQPDLAAGNHPDADAQRLAR